MTVIKKPEPHFADPNSQAPSDTESLHLGNGTPSETGSTTDESIIIPVTSYPKFLIYVPHWDWNLKKRGKRKQRRFKNNSVLESLAEGDEDELWNKLNLAQHQKTPLERLMENDQALQFWEDFNDLPENEQEEIIHKKDAVVVDCDSSHKKSMKKIALKARKMLKHSKLPLKFLLDMENEVIRFFNVELEATFEKPAKNRLEVFLLHSIAMFHKFSSSNTRKEDAKFVCIHGNTGPECISSTEKFSDLVKTKQFDYKAIADEE